MVGPWSRPERMQESLAPLGEKIGFGAIMGIVLGVLVLGGVIARRNLRLGRGDRAGALRVSWFLFGVTFAQWIVGHHAADPGEFFAMLRWIATGCYWALYMGVMYLALEPYVRRRWPDVLISWSRLLSGRFRDPLVGRDLVVGAAAGCLVASGYLFLASLPAWFDVPGLSPLPRDMTSLRGIGGLMSVVLEQPLFAVLVGQVFLFVIFLVSVVVRRRGAAMAIGGLVVLLTGFPQENVAVELPFVILEMMILIAVLFRFGLLAVVISQFVIQILLQIPLTLDPSRWYFGHGMLGVAIVLGLAIYGFHTSLGGQKAFGGLSLEES